MRIPNELCDDAQLFNCQKWKWGNTLQSIKYTSIQHHNSATCWRQNSKLLFVSYWRKKKALQMCFITLVCQITLPTYVNRHGCSCKSYFSECLLIPTIFSSMLLGYTNWAKLQSNNLPSSYQWLFGCVQVTTSQQVTTWSSILFSTQVEGFSQES
jgi:hypothetical protein